MSTDDTRDRLLETAARIYAEGGYHGTTTRRIAQEAGVNEVTIFRHFGSKDALIRSSLEHADQLSRPTLDFGADDPVAELHRWALEVFASYHRHRDLIRRLMGDMVQFPEIAPRFCEDNMHEWYQLTLFIERQQQRGHFRRTDELFVRAAAGSLLGAVFMHAMWRDTIPDIPPPAVAIASFVDVMLSALSVRQAVPAAGEG